MTIKHSKIKFYLAIVGVTLSLGGFASGANAHSHDDTVANKLFVEAMVQYREAKKSSEVEFSLTLYKNTLSNIETIIDKHPSSDIAVQIMAGRAGSHDWFKELENTIKKQKKELERYKKEQALFEKGDDCLKPETATFLTSSCIVSLFQKRVHSLQPNAKRRGLSIMLPFMEAVQALTEGNDKPILKLMAQGNQMSDQILIMFADVGKKSIAIRLLTKLHQGNGYFSSASRARAKAVRQFANILRRSPRSEYRKKPFLSHHTNKERFCKNKDLPADYQRFATSKDTWRRLHEAHDKFVQDICSDLPALQSAMAYVKLFSQKDIMKKFGRFNRDEGFTSPFEAIEVLESFNQTEAALRLFHSMSLPMLKGKSNKSVHSLSRLMTGLTMESLAMKLK